MEDILDQIARLTGMLRLDLLAGLGLATLLGGLIGLEREASGKPAGLRTNILICVGATLITDLSMSLSGLFHEGDVRADPGRLAAQIVSGIGFLGAGTIIQARGTVSGLTSAATLWVVAGIGIAVGTRHQVEAIGTTALVLAVLVPLGFIERRLSHWRRSRIIRVTVVRRPEAMAELRALVTSSGLSIRKETVIVEDECLMASLQLRGNAACYLRCRDTLVNCAEVRMMELR